MDPFYTAMNRVIDDATGRLSSITSAREVRATGNHRAAQNDEPEPDTAGDLTEEDLLEIDRRYSADKDSGALQARREDRLIPVQEAMQRARNGSGQ